MRIKSRRYVVDKLFVLGAGASYSATRPNAKYRAEALPIKQTPLDRHFTGVLKDLRCVRPTWVNDAVEQLNMSWRDHQDFTSMGLEEAILTQAANMKFTAAIRPRRKRNWIEFDEFIDCLAHLVAFYLRRSREGSEKIYTKFSERYFCETNTRNRIISFNYDDVLDKALLQHHTLEDLYFSALKPAQKKDPVSGGSTFPMLLKLHGSVNWNCSTKDFQAMVRQDMDLKSPYYIEEIWFRKTGCPKISDETSPCIIPPVESKPITLISLFRFLWTRACEYLHECRELVVCGYSLPPTDALAAALFKEFNNDRLETVTIVDPNPSIMTKWRTLLARTNVRSARWIYYSDFGEYVDNL